MLILFIMIIVVRLAAVLFKDVRKKMEEIKHQEISQLKSEYEDWQLDIVKIALPFRCLEFFFSNDKSMYNHVPSQFSIEQIKTLKKIIENDYLITEETEIPNYFNAIILRLLKNNKISKDMMNAVNSHYQETNELPYFTDTIFKALELIKNNKWHTKRDQKYLAYFDECYTIYIEELYLAHFALILYEIGYISETELKGIYDERLVNIKNLTLDERMKLFINWNKVVKTNYIVSSIIFRKIRRTSFGKYGVYN